MRLSAFVSCFSAIILIGCGTTASSTGADASADDVALDAAGTELPLADATPDTALSDGVGNEVLDVAADIVADAAPDVSADVAPDVAPDSAPDVAADVAPDVPPDVFNNGCCQTDAECAKGTICVPGKECVPVAPAGKCWFDSDCKSGKCENAAVCPCTADCSFDHIYGTCSDNLGSCCGGDKGSCTTGEACVDAAHVCKSTGTAQGLCWSDADCKTGTCQGASVCPCGAMCLLADKQGTCVDNVKPGGCCNTNGGICAVGESCAKSAVCKPKTQLGKGQCWNDTDCAFGTCGGVNVCPCGAMCLVADKPGTCSGAPTTCTTVDPNSFGLCDMVIGYVFDGKACVLASGCGCGNQCAAVFPDEAACAKACGI